MEKKRRAAALRYDPDKEDAPRIIATGEGFMGEKIAQIARENQVPLVQDEDLAKILTELDVGSEIPPHLYQAVAEILIFVMKLDQEYRKST